MKVHELVKQLSTLPDQNMEVCILDYRKNLHYANADEEDPENGKGIEPNFEVGCFQKNVTKPFIGLSFKNTDYK